MKKLALFSFAFALGLSVVAFAQDTMKQDDTMKNDNMKSEKMSKTSIRLMGKIGEDAKTLGGYKDNYPGTVSTPEALKGHEGRQVALRPHRNPDKGEIH